jgi:8-oxo-dGTP diphosphatase
MHLHNERQYSYCPHCAGGLELRSLKSTEPERLVLVRRAIEPGYGKWVFPGGYVDRGEEVLTAAVREAREEAGLDIRIERLVNVYSYAGSAPVIIVYVASIVGGLLACDDEGLEARFFPPDTIPWEALAFRSTYQALREFLGLP